MTSGHHYACFYQAGLLDRWGTSGQRPPLEENPSTPGPPREVGLPTGWADTGSASSADIDSDSPTAATLSLTVVVDRESIVKIGRHRIEGLPLPGIVKSI